MARGGQDGAGGKSDRGACQEYRQAAQAGTTEPKVHKPKMQQPEPIQPSRQRVQDGLFAVLSMVDDDQAWTPLGELALLLARVAERLDADRQQRMEQALSPLWHLIDAHRTDE